MFKMMSGFPREKIDIVKQNGKKLCQIDALIGDSTALIEDTTIVIEENDYIVRILPNGLVENYIVTDNGYCGGSGHGIPPHYQVKMKKIVKIPTNHKNDLEDRSIINPMKEKLIHLVDDIPRIEARFKHFTPSKGLIIPECDLIYNDPDFISWLENIKYVLQDIYDKSNDKYVWDIINPTGIIHKFNGKSGDERELFNKLKSSLNIIAQNADRYYSESSSKGDFTMKKPMLFISHASADIKYVQPLVELLADIGLNNETMFCSSVPDYHIPMDNDIYDSGMNARVRELLEGAIQSDGIEELFESGKHIEVDIFSDEYMNRINAIQLQNTKIKILQRLLSQAIEEYKKVKVCLSETTAICF